MQPAPIGALADPQLAYTQQGYVAVTQVAPKSPGLALLGSFFFPGLGQLINGQVGKGIAMFVAYLVSIALLFVFIGFLLVPAIWIWSMVDAYSGAKQWNARHGILAAERVLGRPTTRSTRPRHDPGPPDGHGVLRLRFVACSSSESSCSA